VPQNLARIFCEIESREAVHVNAINLEEAIPLLEQGDSPQQHGNRLRAQWLKARLAEADESD
jgi:hypothetical protein